MKFKKITAWMLVLSTVVSCASLGGCGNAGQKQYEVPNYQGLLKEGQEKSDYNKNLFFRNDK